MPPVKRIALLMSRESDFFRQLLVGIQSYATGKRNWLIRSALPERVSLRPLEKWNPHGIIADVVDESFARSLVKLGVPLVDIACARAEVKMPVVDVDHRAVGRLAAKYFLERGYRTFGFFGSDCVWYGRLREEGFREAIAQVGGVVSSCHFDYRPRLSPGLNWTRVSSRVRSWLKGLAHPVAILASNDIPAHDLADACHQIGLRVPEDVAILGVGNDELECRLTFPPLSSVAIPGERIGYEAARILDSQLRGDSAPDRPVFLPPVRVVTRQSTSELAVEDVAVAAAVRYISNRLSEPLPVATIAEALGLHRRELERRFRAALGRSVLQEIHRARIEQVKTLLVETDLSMPLVARQCGFSNAQRLAVVFRQTAGVAPSAYRRQSRPGEPS